MTSTGGFGPRVEATVRELESRYRNIVVVSSKSGKMTSFRMREWIDRVLAPALADRLRSSDIETEVGEGGLYNPGEDNVFVGEDPRQLYGYPERAPDNVSYTDHFYLDVAAVCAPNTDRDDRNRCKNAGGDLSAKRLSLIHI